MKNHIQVLLTFLILLTTFNANIAVAIELNSFRDAGDERNITSKIKTFRMTWIFDLDIDNLKQNNLLKKEGKLSKYLTLMNLYLNDIPNGISRIHMYGNGSTKNTSIVIFGEIERLKIENYVRIRVLKKQDTVIKSAIINKNNKDILKLTVKGQNGKTKDLYIGSYNKNLHIVSFNRNEVLAWTYNLSRLKEYNKATDNNSLISLSIDIKRTLNNMRKENITDTYIMQSKVFQYVSDINAVLKESDQSIYFGAVLTAPNKKTVEQLYSTISNLLDTNYSEIKSGTNKILANMQLKKQSNTVRIGTYFDKNAL